MYIDIFRLIDFEDRRIVIVFPISVIVSCLLSIGIWESCATQNRME